MSFPTAATWTPLAQRMETLPLILAGPILRRVEPGSATVWVALRAPRVVALRVFRWIPATGELMPQLEGARKTVRLGDRLHVAAVTAGPTTDGDHLLEPGSVYCYDLSFEDLDASSADGPVNLSTPGVLVRDPATASEIERLTFAGLPLPSFVLPAAKIEHVRIFHGSCRKPHGSGRDSLATLDLALSRSVTDPLDRPQQLFLTGDQIYADDVAQQLLAMLMDSGEVLVGPEELPGLPPNTHLIAPGHRAWAVREAARFTTSTPQSHLLTRGEYLAMYLFTWSDALWPDALISLEETWRAYPQALPSDEREREKMVARWRLDEGELNRFRETLPYVRRALANTPTYMICDDHDVTDDWYLDGAWCSNVLSRPLGRRIIRNALYAYALCQAWGNDPEQFDGRKKGEGPGGGYVPTFLNVVDRWRGDEPREEESVDAALIADYLSLPEEFSGEGSLPKSPQALHWHFSVETPAYRMLVLDSRTQRVYAHPHEAPGLLSNEAMQEQIGAQAPGDTRLTLLVSATPVLGVDIVEEIQLLSLDHYAFDRESWALNRQIWQALLRRLAQFERVVILSGDVHYGFGSMMDYWEQAAGPSGEAQKDVSTPAMAPALASETDPETDSAASTIGSVVPGKATIVNFTSSSLKNATSGANKALLTVAYPHLFHLLSRGRMPPIDLFAWNDGSSENAHALAAATHAVQHGALAVWWSVPRVATMLRSPSALVLPAHGWPPHAFDECPPDRRVRLQYLRDTRSPDEQDAGQSLPGLGTESPLAELDALRSTHTQRVRETAAALTSDAHLGVDKALEATRLLESADYPHPVRLSIAQRLLHLAQTAFESNQLLPRLQERIATGINHLLTAALAHPEMWERVWADGGLHIVGEANIGEIRFELKAPGMPVAIQRLWWHAATAPDDPLQVAEYRASLRLPSAEDAPALP